MIFLEKIEKCVNYRKQNNVTFYIENHQYEFYWNLVSSDKKFSQKIKVLEIGCLKCDKIKTFLTFPTLILKIINNDLFDKFNNISSEHFGKNCGIIINKVYNKRFLFELNNKQLIEFINKFENLKAFI